MITKQDFITDNGYEDRSETEQNELYEEYRTEIYGDVLNIVNEDSWPYEPKKPTLSVRYDPIELGEDLPF